jgi:hypothetical protein
MGVQDGGKLFYSLKELKFIDVVSLCQKRAEEAGRTGKPAVAVDVSWLCHLFGHHSTTTRITQQVMSVLLVFANNGFVVYAVFDPDERHHTKKASIVRVFSNRQKMFECVRLKAEMVSKCGQIREEVDGTARDTLLAERATLESKIKKIENGLRNVENVPLVVEGIRTKLQELSLTTHIGKINIQEGLYQADSVIEHLLAHLKVDIAVGNDSDFGIVAGPCSLQISALKIKNGILESIHITTACQTTMEKCRLRLGDAGTFSDAKYPLVNG